MNPNLGNKSLKYCEFIGGNIKKSPSDIKAKNVKADVFHKFLTNLEKGLNISSTKVYNTNGQE